MRYLVAAIVISFASSSIQAGAPAANTTWKNQRGSILQITSVDATGVITGKYTNNADGYQCKGVPYDIVGHDLTTGFFFGVSFPLPCNTIVSWRAGALQGNMFTSTWALSTIDPDTGVIETVSGGDTFTQQ
jgi:hypothetical protein